MNRWRQRLAELQGAGRGHSCASPHTVQNVQNVQNPGPDPAFEHFVRFEHDTVPPADPAAEAKSTAAERAAATWAEGEAERAAIVEHDGGIPRDWAEGFACLDPDRAPADVPPVRWRRFVDDVGRFLDSPFCAVAAALGWAPDGLFGCDRARPFARVDSAGLLLLLNGDRLVALTENTATIETRTGARQTYRRKPNEPGRVLAWELIQ
jgi:hypothetical protein